MTMTPILDQLLRARKAKLNLSALATLHLVRAEAWPMHALAHALELSSAAFTGVVDGLEKQGLVKRETHPHDRRIWRVTITPAGVALLGGAPAAPSSPTTGTVPAMMVGVNPSTTRPTTTSNPPYIMLHTATLRQHLNT